MKKLLMLASFFAARDDVAPILVNNTLTIHVNETVALTPDDLAATDADSDDSLLRFGITNIQHGGFSFVSDPFTPITAFYQQNITDEVVQFHHDGSFVAPMYQVSVSDGGLSSPLQFSNITFTGPGVFPAVIPAEPKSDDLELEYSASHTASIRQRRSALGEFRVNTYTTSVQARPSVTGLTGGGFVVTWESYEQDGRNLGVYGQRYDVSGGAQEASNLERAREKEI